MAEAVYAGGVLDFEGKMQYPSGTPPTEQGTVFPYVPFANDRDGRQKAAAGDWRLLTGQRGKNQKFGSNGKKKTIKEHTKEEDSSLIVGKRWSNGAEGEA